MALRSGTILEVEDQKPEEVEVEEENTKVRGVRRALRDTGTVKVRDEEGRVLFYCMSPREWRRLKSAADPEG